MTITKHHDVPCWEVYRPETGYHPNEEQWPHHATREEAEKEQAEYAEPTNEWEGHYQCHVEVRQSFDRPCARIVCDGCDDELDVSGDGWTHFNPSSEPIGPGVDWSDIEWVQRGERHYHQDCAPPWCYACETEGHDEDDCEVQS